MSKLSTFKSGAFSLSTDGSMFLDRFNSRSPVASIPKLIVPLDSNSTIKSNISPETPKTAHFSQLFFLQMTNGRPFSSPSGTFRPTFRLHSETFRVWIYWVTQPASAISPCDTLSSAISKISSSSSKSSTRSETSAQRSPDQSGSSAESCCAPSGESKAPVA